MPLRSSRTPGEKVAIRCGVPTLVIYGSEELARHREYIKKLKGTLSKAQFHEIEGANHFDTFGRPEFVEKVRASLDDHGSRHE